MIKVRGIDLPVDVKAEIETYEWHRAKWRHDRLIACSPFRDEKSPSFAVNFENGTFIDSGGDGDFRKGNFVKLLAYLQGSTYEETEEYLIALYSPQYGDISEMELPSVDDWDEPEANTNMFDKAALQPFQYTHPYLINRGIPQIIQDAFDVGFDPQTNSVVLVWHDLKGNIVSWKHRSVDNKVFWYVKDGQPIRNHLYGIHWVVKRNFKKVWIVESEIDALTLWTKGIPAVALGSSYLSREKKNVLLKAGVQHVVIATDNDKDGNKAKRSIIQALAGRVAIDAVNWDGIEFKDINDARNIINDLHVESPNIFGW